MIVALAMFVGGASLEAVERLAAPSTRPLDVVTSLRDKSLVVSRTSEDGTPRFGMLETIREYIVERLRGEGRWNELRHLHATYLVELAERAEPELQRGDHPEWLGRLAAEQ